MNTDILNRGDMSGGAMSGEVLNNEALSSVFMHNVSSNAVENSVVNSVNNVGVNTAANIVNNSSKQSIYNLSWISDEYVDMILSILPLVVGFGVFYFFVIKPQNDQAAKIEQEKQDKLDSLAIGDTVMLNSGIKGTVEKLGKKYIFISIALKTVVEVDKSYITVVEK